jgi:hypothetical protein
MGRQKSETLNPRRQQEDYFFFIFALANVISEIGLN